MYTASLLIKAVAQTSPSLSPPTIKRSAWRGIRKSLFNRMCGSCLPEGLLEAAIGLSASNEYTCKELRW